MLVSAPDNLPRQLSSFIGREREIAEIKRLLATSALLTLTGAGGSGKTRLALQVARELRDRFRHGVFFVNLAPIADLGLVVPTIARTLGVEESPGASLLDNVKSFLRDKHVLLILDNFEQVLEAAPFVADLLIAGPDVKAMVTSREPLRLRGEQRYQVPPLELPEPTSHQVTAQELSGYEAVALFVQRTQAIRSEFTLTEDNAITVAEICRRLDGLPLAIELAAARAGQLNLQTLADRLGTRLRLLTGGPRDVPARQQTLRNAIDWSFSLLSKGEKRLFQRMAVFQGGRTLDALETVCDYDKQLEVEVLDGVDSLVAKSLLQQRNVEKSGREAEPRFWMLETIHEYAREKLQESGERPALQREHALYFMKLAEEARPQLVGPDQVEWFDRLEAEQDNFRAVLQWSGEQGKNGNSEALEIGLSLAAGMGRFWDLRGYFTEARGWLSELLSSANLAVQNTDAREVAVSTVALVDALDTAGWLARGQGDFETAITLLETACDLARDANYKAGMALSFVYLGTISQMSGDLLAARSLCEQGLGLFTDLGDKWGTALALNYLGDASLALGDYQIAHAFLERSLAIRREIGDKRGTAQSLANLYKRPLLEGDYLAARAVMERSLALRVEIGDKWGTAVALLNLANVCLMQRDYHTASSLLERSLIICRELGDKKGIAGSLSGLGQFYLESGQRAHALRGAKLIGAADALWEALRIEREWEDKLPYDRAIGAGRSQLGEEAFEQARQQGRGMDLDAAIAFALEDQLEAGPDSSKDSNALPLGLTGREAEVLGLVAKGLTNAQVAQQLFLSPATVNAHLTSIYGKLGVAGRPAAIRFAVEHKLL